MVSRLIPIVIVAALAVSAAPAAGQVAPTLGSPETTQTAVTPVTTSASTGNGGLKPWQEILIFAAGIALLAGIAIAIISDARQRAPTPEGDLATVGPHRHGRETKDRARARGKAARKARRKNR